jgi:hypothetical protein
VAFDTDIDCKLPYSAEGGPTTNNNIARQSCRTELNGRQPIKCPSELRRAAVSSGADADGKDSWKWLLLDPAGQ